jgi:transposase-like protein
MVELARSGRNVNDLANEFEVSDFSIRKWMRDADLQSKPEILSEKEELKQLRREVKILREERDILKKAAAWFAQETGTPSTKRSKS